MLNNLNNNFIGSPEIDPIRGVLSFTITTDLLVDYFDNLGGILLSSRGLPSGTAITRLEKNKAKLEFSLVGGVDIDSGKVPIEPMKIARLIYVIRQFVDKAIKHELLNTAFIPLDNYTSKDLIRDSKIILAKKQNIRFLKKSEDIILSIDGLDEVKFEQVFIQYDSNEFFDIILLLRKGEIDKIREIVADKFEEVIWKH